MSVKIRCTRTGLWFLRDEWKWDRDAKIVECYFGEWGRECPLGLIKVKKSRKKKQR